MHNACTTYNAEYLNELFCIEFIGFFNEYWSL